MSNSDIDLEQLVRDNTRELLSWALHRTSDRQTAEDLVQDTFLAAAESSHSFEGLSQPRTWLFGILNNKIAQYYRSKHRSRNLTFLPSNELERFFDEHGAWRAGERPELWGTDESHPLDSPGFGKILHACMQDLNPVWHSVMHLRYLDKKKSDDICQDLGISATNYWQILHRAKLKLRVCLEKNWFRERQGTE